MTRRAAIILALLAVASVALCADARRLLTMRKTNTATATATPVPVLQWTFDTVGNPWLDTSGNGHSITGLSYLVTRTNTMGNATSFAYSPLGNSYGYFPDVSVPDSGSLLFLVECFYLYEFDSMGWMFRNGSSTTGSVRWVSNNSSYGVTAQSYTNSTMNEVVSFTPSSVLTNGIWVSLAITWSPSGVSAYTNGILVGTTSGSKRPQGVATWNGVRTRYVDSGRALDQLELYNVCLTSQEVYNAALTLRNSGNYVMGP